MTLAEVLAAALVLAIAAGSSLRVWAGLASSSQSAQLQEQGLVQIDADLLRSERTMRQLASGHVPFDNCDAALALMQQALASGGVGLPVAVTRQVLSKRLLLDDATQEVLVLRYLLKDGGGVVRQRERMLTPQAYGLCGGASGTAQQTVAGELP